MLPNERFALERRAYYDFIGLVVDASNGEFAHCPLTRKECDTGYYLLHNDHQQHGLIQSRDLGKLCFFSGDVKRWLINCDPIPDNYFELWDIYDEYSRENGRKTMGKLHAEKNEEGKSLHTLRLHVEKNEEGKSVNAVKGAKKAHEEKNEEGKSVISVKGGKKVHEGKNKEGKSLHTLKINEEKNEEGKSVNAVKGGKKVHEEKNEGGKSLLASKLHEEKNEEGKSAHAVKMGKAIALKKQRGVQLIRIKDGEVFIFESLKFAAEILNIESKNISAVCKGKRKTVGGYTAEYWDG